MTVIATSRDQLHHVRQRARAAEAALKKARQIKDAANASGDPDAGIAELAVQEAEIEADTARGWESMLLSRMAGVSSNGYGWGESIFSDPQTVAALERLAVPSSMPFGRIEGPLWSVDEVVDMLNAGDWGPSRPRAASPTIPQTDPSRQAPHYGVRPQLRTRLSILDLIPSASLTSGSGFHYHQEAGSFDTALEVAEGQLKPEADLQTPDAVVEIQTIAHWLKFLRPQASDVPGLTTTAQTRLTYGVMLRLQTAVLSGDGVGSNILGLLNSGIGSVPYVAGPLTDLTLDGITAITLADAEPTGVVVHPTDLATMLKATATGSGDRLDSGGAFSTVPTSMWGLPLVVHKAIPVGSALVGDFNQATVYVREAVNLRISDSDQDDFLRNRFTMLAEGRFGLAVWAPQAFTLVDLTATLAQAQEEQPKAAPKK